MGHLLDLLSSRPPPAHPRVWECEKSEISEKTPPAPPVISLLSLISQPKTSATAAGATPYRDATGTAWDAADWRAFYDERAGIAEFDGKMPRAKAEIMAFESCLLQWLRQHPARSDPGRCVWCGGTDRPGHVVVPFGTANAGHAWLHSLCWKPWHEKRRAAAAEALAALGLEPPRSA